MTWLDIGDMQSRYSEAGAHSEQVTFNRSVEWPAILRGSGHIRGKGYWIGVKDWTDEQGRNWGHRVAMTGPRQEGTLYFTPVQTRLIAKFEDTEVIVDGAPSFDKIARVDEVNPDLPADRVLYQKYRSILGVETERWVYAYANELHDDYHIIRRQMINNGNTDRDEDIELQGQALNDVLFFNSYRWVGREQAGWHHSVAQVWGKFSMNDVVGDGNEAYPVDFTAIYLWAGHDPSYVPGWNLLGSPMLPLTLNSFTAQQVVRLTAPGDTIGRLAGMSMQGRMVLHADESTTDRTYNPANQPVTIGFMDSDENLNWPGRFPDREYYESGMLNNRPPSFWLGIASRMYPHFADRIEPSGQFWNPTRDASTGRSGGFSSTLAYGPYQMAFMDTVHIVEAEGAAGLSYKAATDIGVAYKESGFDDELRIPFDANGDGLINDAPWDYDVYKNGSELQTKNQWVMTARDSMFQFMYRARDVWAASNNMTQYPIVEPPRPPRRFEVTSHPDHIELQWQALASSADPEQWEIYRTTRDSDNLPYALIATVSGAARNYIDQDVLKGIHYYYFIQAVGAPNTMDERGLTGTPGGLPLKSGRYFTQTYHPASLLRPPGEQVSDFRIVPNPINLAADESVRVILNGDPTRSRVEFLEIPGQCTISIFTEIGELVRRLEHTDGSGNTTWDLLTSSRQPVVSGIYIVRVVDNESGEADVKKMVVVR